VAAGTNDNEIEDNKVTGNTNGIILAPGVVGNVVRRNFVVGNPLPDDAPGVDIRNGATVGANTIEDNVCLTAVNAPCPAIDKRGPHDKDKNKDDKKDKK